jgi:hypothetical protein
MRLDSPTLVSDFKTETTTNLAISGVFTGAAHDLGPAPTPVRKFEAYFISSHASATDGAAIEISDDNATYRVAAKATLAANVAATLSVSIFARYARVKLTNGATATTSLFVASSKTRT